MFHQTLIITRPLFVLSILFFVTQANAELSFHRDISVTVQQIEDIADKLPPPPTSEDCYHPDNVGAVGQWSGCRDLLIVTDGLSAFGIHRAINSGITLNGTTYGATNIFTGQVTDMGALFDSDATFNEDIGYWDTKNVTNFTRMFSHAGVFNQDISPWDVSSGRYFSYMFDSTPYFSADLGQWDVSSAVGMTRMFQMATSFNADLRGWCVSGFSSEPSGFSQWSYAFLSTNQPVWGTCPP